MDNRKYNAVDRLFFTSDDKASVFYADHSIVFDNSHDYDSFNNPHQISLPLVAYLEEKYLIKQNNLAIAISQSPNMSIMLLEMDVAKNDRVAVSISDVGAIYGLWFKREDYYVNTSISVGATFNESVALVGLILEANFAFEKNKDIKKLASEIEKQIAEQGDITEIAKHLTEMLREYAAGFIWLNNFGEISYRELYIHSLKYKSPITKVLLNKDNFLLFT